MTPNETQGAKGFYKLSWLQRIGFGSGDLAQNLIFQVICTYLLFFYTDIYGLTPSAVAVMFLVGNVVSENTVRICSMWAFLCQDSPFCASTMVLHRRSSMHT
jgi:hypothetical protein